MEEENSHDYGEEPANCSNYSISGHTQPFLEEDSWAGHHGCGEEDVVNRCNNGRVKNVESFVQVTDLNADTDHQTDE